MYIEAHSSVAWGDMGGEEGETYEAVLALLYMACDRLLC
jgi:hypothetical protein